MDAVTDGEFRRMSFIATIGVRDAELGPLTGFKTLVTDAEWTGLWKYPDGSFGGLTQPDDRPRRGGRSWSTRSASSATSSPMNFRF